jgi:hypothetical protein
MACNARVNYVTKHMFSHNVIFYIKEILVDERHDWPTNGASLALLQYAHQALSDAEIYL